MGCHDEEGGCFNELSCVRCGVSVWRLYEEEAKAYPLGLFQRGSGFMMIPGGGFRGKKRVVWCGVVLEENNINYILRFNSLIFLVEFVFLT